MIFVGVVLLGVISLSKLPQELFPPIKYPLLTVFTTYSNAAPEEVETLLTRPIEEAVGTVSGLRSIRSISKEGVSLVFAEFSWDQNMDFAALRVREKVDLIKARLPRDSSEPLVVPFNPFELPIMRLSVTGKRDLVQLRRLAEDIIKGEIEKISGVAAASVEGGLQREIVVEVNQNKLQTYGVPILDVSDSITNANLNYPAGTIKESFYEYLIRTLGEFEKIDDIGNVVVRTKVDESEDYLPFEEKMKRRNISSQPNLIIIKDVSKIVDTYKERSSYSRQNGEENVSVSIQKQAQTNTVQVIDRIKKALGAIKKRLPPDIELAIVYDQSSYIKDAINGVWEAAWQGGLLAFLVLLLFLQNAMASAIVTIGIPVSVFFVFTLMYFGGLTLNIMSLGGLALGIGMLVDCGVVTIENIFRHRGLGEPATEAAIAGAEEVTGAVTASTLTNVAVFFPMIFIIGIAGQLFKELAFTVIWSNVGSLWVSITIIPVMSRRLHKKQEDIERGLASFEGGHIWKRILNLYGVMLEKFLRNKKKGLIFTLWLFVGSLCLIFFMEKELMPKADQGEFVIKVDLPVGSRVEETNRIALLLEEEIQKNPVVESVSTVVGATKGESAKDIVKSIGSNQAQIIVALKEKRRKVKTIDVISELQDKFTDKKYKPAKIEILMQQGMVTTGGAFGEGGAPVTLEVKGDNLDEMADIARRVKEEIRKIPAVFGVEDDLPEPSPEVRIKIDKDKAALYNLSVVDLARVAQIIMRGYIPSQLKEKGKEIDIRVILRPEDRDTFDKLYRIRINSPTHGAVPLGTVAKFERGVGPSEIRRISQERTITITANVADRRVSDVLSDVQKVLSGIKIEKGNRVKIAGESEEMKKSFASLQFALILSIVLIYMVMAAQFESLMQPFLILFSLPLALIGVLVALFVTRISINVVSLFGVIMLGGIVVNNAIVLIDFINSLMREKKKEIFEAVVEASKTRLRPILMTALTAVFGLVPMAISSGRGSELRVPMAMSVMGGLLSSTFLTLFVIPAIFIMEDEIRGGIKKNMKNWRMDLNVVKVLKQKFEQMKNRINGKKSS